MEKKYKVGMEVYYISGKFINKGYISEVFTDYVIIGNKGVFKNQLSTSYEDLLALMKGESREVVMNRKSQNIR